MSDESEAPTDTRPRYLQIRDALVELYVEGRPADSALPPERVLAEDFGVTRSTLRRAVDELESAGLVYRVQGGGTFCVGPGVAKSLKLTSFSEDIRARGRVPGSIVRSARLTKADADASRWLRISPGTSVFELVRIRFADNEPMCLETSILPAAIVPGIVDRDLRGSMYSLLSEVYDVRPSWADQTVSATVVTPEEAAFLGVAPFSPALRITRVSCHSRGKPIEYAVTTYRADMYSLRHTIRRD